MMNNHLSNLNNIDCKLLELTKPSLWQTVLYGNTLFDKEKNTCILNATIEYILSTERFEEPLIPRHCRILVPGNCAF